MVYPVGQGFGEYDLPDNTSFTWMQTSLSVQAVAIALFFTAIAVVGVALTMVIPAGGLLLGTIIVLSASVVVAKEILTLIGITWQAPPTNDIFQELEGQVTPLSVPSEEEGLSGFPTTDSAASYEWKMRLIRSAHSSIVLSGCYCGGEAFNVMLEEIGSQMERKLNLQVIVLCTEILLTSDNRKLLQLLTKTYSERFQSVVHPEIFPHLSPSDQTVRLSINHTKILVIDQGAAFVIGGSGVVNTWALENGTEENLGWLYGCVMPKAFRDNDFVFHSESRTGVGARIYLETIKLAKRLNRHLKVPEWKDNLENTVLQEYETCHPLEGLTVTPFATGPERTHNAYLEEMIRCINLAKEEIVIDHMYFHPSSQLLQTLVKAARNGVKITILTNTSTVDSPGSHNAFTALSRMQARSLVQQAPQQSVVLYEYHKENTTLHKKIVLIDRSVVFLGSSNIGWSSLEGQSAYELNVKVESEAFGQATWLHIHTDLQVSNRVDEQEARHISWSTACAATAQSMVTAFL